MNANRKYSGSTWRQAVCFAGLLGLAVSALGCGGRRAMPTDAAAEVARSVPSAPVVEAVLSGAVLYAEGDFQGAAQAFADAVAAAGPDPYLMDLLSSAKARSDALGHGAAKTALSDPIRFDPAARLAEKGRVALDGDRQREAESMLGAALRLSPGRTAERLLLIDMLLRQGRVAEARRHIDSLPPPEDTVSAVIERVRLLHGAAMFQEARALIFAYSGAGAPETGELRSLLAATECALGRPEAASALTGRSVPDRAADAECVRSSVTAGARPRDTP